MSAAQNLRKELGQKPDADWDKVVIMGKQICPDERLFAEATAAAGQVDVDLQAGDSPLDLAFDEAAEEAVDLDLGQSTLASFDLEATGGTAAPKAPPRAAPKAVAPKAAAKPKSADLDDMLEIGERTAAGLESAFEDLDAEDDDGEATSTDLADSLAVTQESPTIERPSQSNDWAKMSLEDTGDLPSGRRADGRDADDRERAPRLGDRADADPRDAVPAGAADRRAADARRRRPQRPDRGDRPRRPRSRRQGSRRPARTTSAICRPRPSTKPTLASSPCSVAGTTCFRRPASRRSCTTRAARTNSRPRETCRARRRTRRRCSRRACDDSTMTGTEVLEHRLETRRDRRHVARQSAA